MFASSIQRLVSDLNAIRDAASGALNPAYTTAFLEYVEQTSDQYFLDLPPRTRIPVESSKTGERSPI